MNELRRGMRWVTLRAGVMLAAMSACFPSFDGLTGGLPADAGIDHRAEDGEDASDASEAGEPTDAAEDTTGDADLDQRARADVDPADASETDAANGDGAMVCESGVYLRDSSVCNTCNRDCEKGDCIAGECLPFVVVAGQTPVRMALSDTSIYWTSPGNDGAVYRASKDGSGVVAIATRQQNPSGIWVTRDRVYWTNQGSGEFKSNDGAVISSAFDGTDVKIMASAQKRPVAVTADTNNNLYWASRGLSTMSQPSDGAIVACPIANCANSAIRTLSSAVFPTQLVYRSSALYWTSETVDTDSLGSIWQLPLTSSGSATTSSSRLFTDAINADQLSFLDNSTLFYASSTRRTIGRRSRTSASEVRYTGNFEPQALLWTSNRIYWLNAKDGSVASGGSIARAGQDDLRADGAAPPSLKTFALPAAGGDSIVDDDKAIYFTTTSGIMKMVK